MSATRLTTARVIRGLLTILMMVLVSDAAALAQRSRGAVRSSARTSASRNVARHTDVNRNRNVNRNVDIDRDLDIDRDIDIDVDNRYGCCYRSGWGTAAAIATTAAVVGSIVYTLPSSCSTVVVDGFTYQQCGDVWYQPRIAGGSTTYIVVNSPR
jgi:hypothetical protein